MILDHPAQDRQSASVRVLESVLSLPIGLRLILQRDKPLWKRGKASGEKPED